MFARALKSLLESVSLDFDDWGMILNVTKETVDDWCHNRAIPTPRQLVIIYNIVKTRNESDEVEVEVKKFEAVISRKSNSVPFGECMLPTISSYMFRPIKEDISHLCPKKRKV